jgi:two-component system, chemotaxis family, protein-glutamate methylesterase/glutaminase
MAFAIVVVGASLGGFQALKWLLGGLPEMFPLPLAIVQHQGADAGGELTRFLQRYSALVVTEAEDKQPILPGRAYVAPAGYHLLVEPGTFALSTEGPVLYARPSIDVLFESAADSYGEGVIGVALTGASHDGAHGLAQIKAHGGLALVQDPATAESPVLPKAAIKSTAVDRILPLLDIAPFLVGLCHQPARF